MKTKLNNNDAGLLNLLADYRVLTVGQMAVLYQISKQAVRRRLNRLADAGVVELDSGVVGGRRGRPESVGTLSEQAIDGLKKDGTLHTNMRASEVIAEGFRQLNHQLLLNWFRIHLVHVERLFPRLTVQFLASNSLLFERGPDGRPLVFDRAASGASPEQSIGFTPDGVFSIADRDTGKTLLFFLEVDMGTEALTSTRYRPRAVQQKIANYQAYFRSGRYKCFQELWGCGLNGFRLLFLTTTPSRLTALCRLAREMPPSDFVWLTDRARMFDAGVSAGIWARGGILETPPQSILGETLCCRAPLPNSQS